jgi:hypothetical protein
LISPRYTNVLSRPDLSSLAKEDAIPTKNDEERRDGDVM